LRFMAFSLAYIMVDDALSNPVSDSVALRMLELAAEQLGRADIVGFESARRMLADRESSRAWAQRAASRLRGGRAVALARIPFVSLMKWNAIRAFPYLRDAHNCGGGRLVIHGRGVKGAYVGAYCKHRLPGARLIFDARGTEAYEKYNVRAPWVDEGPFPGPRPAMRRLLGLERLALENADAVNAVSNPMADYLRRRHPGVAFPEPLIIPTCADTSRFQIDEDARRGMRERIGAGNKIVWAYTGGTQAYACPEKLAGLCGKIEKHKPGKSHFLILSRDHETLADLYRQEGVPASAIESRAAAFDDMPKYLAAADVGIVIRELSIVGRANCPVKIAEYLACGLSVLAVGQIGDFGGFAETLPASLSSSAVITAAEIWRRFECHADNSPQRRQSNRQGALKRYSWETHLPRLLSLYKNLGEKPSQYCRANTEHDIHQ
jgi:glycosyltransferase involved in cell wall biosynthesis